MNAEPRIIEFATIDSTNAEAHRRAADGERGPLWIRSDVQEQGRGRSGRAWSSPSGNLSATLLFAPHCDRSQLHQLSFVSALVVHDAIVGYLDQPELLKLKWPNDILIDGAKVCGILVESTRYGQDDVVVIGMGINLAVTPDVEGRAVTRLADHGKVASPQELCLALARKMAEWLAVWNNGNGFGDIRCAWLQRAHAKGQPLAVHVDSTRREGVFGGLDTDGALLLAGPDGSVTRIDHGDVSLVATGSKEQA